MGAVAGGGDSLAGLRRQGRLVLLLLHPQGDEFPKGGAVIAADGTKTRHYEHAKRLNAELHAFTPP